MMRQIDKYMLIQPIGGGAGGSVYLAEEQLPGGITRKVAIKVLPLIPAGNAAATERFLAEARPLVALSGHPHIVTFLNFGVSDGIPWIAMDYVPSNLGQQITDKPASAAEVRRMLVQVAQGLAKMHEHVPPILHNDLKPVNVLFDEYSNYRITDFGLAAQVGTEHTYGLATVRYAAPEALNAEFGAVCPATDLYALGHIAYEMALGEREYRRQFPAIFGDDAASTSVSPAKWMAWHCSMDMLPRSVASVLPAFPAPLAAIVDKLMAKRLDQRYGSARDLLADLGASAADSATEPPRIPPAAHGPAPDAPSVPAPTLPAPAWLAPRAPATPKAWPARTKYMAAAVVGMLMSLLLIVLLDGKPEVRVEVDDKGLTSRAQSIEFTGRVKGLPASAWLELYVDGHKAGKPVMGASDSGSKARRFSGSYSLPKPGETKGEIRAVQGQEILARCPLTLQRKPPEIVHLVLNTTPAVEGIAIRIQPGDGSPIQARTVTGGTADVAVPYGRFTLALSHDDFEPVQREDETGFEPSRPLEVKLVNKNEPLAFRISPPKARVSLRAAVGPTTRDVDVDAGGAAMAQVPTGKYDYVVSAIDYVSRKGEIEVSHGVTNRLELALLPMPKPTSQNVAATPGPTSQPGATVDADALLIAGMNKVDLLSWARKTAEIRSLEVEETSEAGVNVRVKGIVLNQDELAELQNRFKAAKGRVNILAVSVNAQALAQSVQTTLQAMGLKDAKVRDYPRPNGGPASLRVQYTRLAGVTKAQVENAVKEYLFKKESVTVVEYP